MKKEDLIDIQKQYEKNIKHDFNVTLEQYDELCKSETAKCNIEDYNIEKDHTIDEYLKQYGALLQKHKLLAYRKNEVWAMNKKRTYWEIPNDTNLFYFEVSTKHKQKLPVIPALSTLLTPKVGVVALGLTAAAFASLYAWKELTDNVDRSSDSGIHVTLDAGEGGYVELYKQQKVTFPVVPNTTWRDFYNSIKNIPGYNVDKDFFYWADSEGNVLSDDYVIDKNIYLTARYKDKTDDALIITPVGTSINVSLNYYNASGMMCALEGEEYADVTSSENNYVVVNPSQRLFIKRKDTTAISGSLISVSGSFNLSGSIKHIIPSDTLPDNAFKNMFYGCSSLISAANLTLPYNTLSSACYKFLFANCSSLISGPSVLPATTLNSECYACMFSGCSSLLNAPLLPATELASNCYYNMFYECGSLLTPPELPATTLADSCYYQMFFQCYKLTTAPELKAKTLKDHCYTSMFASCYKLTAAPELPATDLAQYCYAYMFNGCSSITVMPELKAKTVYTNCYRSMFRGCSSLTTIVDELPASDLTGATYCYAEMFADCVEITKAPALPASKLANSCYWSMFSNCKNLVIAPELKVSVFDSSYKDCYKQMFASCSKLCVTTTPTDNLIFTAPNVTVNDYFNEMFIHTNGDSFNEPTPVAGHSYYF